MRQEGWQNGAVLHCRPFLFVLGVALTVAAPGRAQEQEAPGADVVEEPAAEDPELEHPALEEGAVEEGAVEEGAVEEGAPPVGRTNTGDALAMLLAAAAGSGGGLAAVAATSFASTYIVVNIFRIGGYTFTARYWRWGALGAIPVVASLLAIPLGAAVGIWWGAGLRGLPLPLVDALALMVVGISLGTLTGALIAGPAGLMGGTFLGGAMLLNGSFSYVIWSQGYNVALAWAFVGVPIIAALGGAAVGGVVGAALGPVLTGAQWGLGAKASYFDEE